MDKSLKKMCFTLVLVACMCVPTMPGCVLRPGVAVEDPDTTRSDRSASAVNPGGTGGNGLIRPVIPQEPEGTSEPAGSGGPASIRGGHEVGTIPGRLSGAAGQDAVPGSTSSGGDRKWEDQKVKQIARDLAGKTPGVKKIKVCLAFKNDEWLIVLYRDTGTSYELKQYFWKRDLPEPEPYLVFERVPKDRLEEHSSRSEPDKACETLDPLR